MKIVRRHFLVVTGITVAVPAVSKFARAQTQAGPKLTQVLRKDVENQGSTGPGDRRQRCRIRTRHRCSLAHASWSPRTAPRLRRKRDGGNRREERDAP